MSRIGYSSARGRNPRSENKLFLFQRICRKKRRHPRASPRKKSSGRAIEDADVVHLLVPFALSRAAIKIARPLGIPLTASFHCQAENLSNHIKLMNNQWFNEQVYRNFYRAVYRYCDCVHYPTQFIKNVFENSTGPTNGFVISNGVNPLFLEPRKNVTRPRGIRG